MSNLEDIKDTTKTAKQGLQEIRGIVRDARDVVVDVKGTIQFGKDFIVQFRNIENQLKDTIDLITNPKRILDQIKNINKRYELQLRELLINQFDLTQTEFLAIKNNFMSVLTSIINDLDIANIGKKIAQSLLKGNVEGVLDITESVIDDLIGRLDRVDALVDLTNNTKERLQHLSQETIQSIADAVNDLAQNYINEIQGLFKNLYKRVIEQNIQTINEIKYNFTQLVNRTSYTVARLTQPNNIILAKLENLSRQTTSSPILVRAYALIDGESYDISEKVYTIIVTASIDSLPSVRLVFNGLTDKERKVITDKSASISLSMYDSSGNLLMIMPMLLPYNIVNIDIYQQSTNLVVLDYWPQFQYDLFYRTSISFSVEPKQKLSDAIKEFALQRFIKILKPQWLNNVTVSKSFNYPQQTVNQIVRAIDEVYHIYDPKVTPSAQFIIPYTNVLTSDGVYSGFIVPYEYRSYVYDELLDKMPIFVYALPVYSEEQEVIREELNKFYNPEYDLLFVQILSSNEISRTVPGEIVRQITNPEALPGIDKQRGKIEFVSPKLHIDKFVRSINSITETLTKGQIAVDKDTGKWFRRSTVALSAGQITFQGIPVPLNPKYMLRLDKLLPGILCKYMFIDVFQPVRMDMRKGYGIIQKITWMWDKSGKRTGSIVTITDISIIPVYQFEPTPVRTKQTIARTNVLLSNNQGNTENSDNTIDTVEEEQTEEQTERQIQYIASNIDSEEEDDPDGQVFI